MLMEFFTYMERMLMKVLVEWSSRKETLKPTHFQKALSKSSTWSARYVRFGLTSSESFARGAVNGSGS